MNIVLIGMPGSGKSTVGAMAARQLGRIFVETDTMIEEREHAPILQIFAQRGEGYFRDVESTVARAASELEQAVISTGGGIILRSENMAALAATGVIFFLDREAADIAGENHSGRPLLAGDKNRIFELYAQRIGLYRRYANHIIPAGRTVEESLERLMTIIEREGIL